LIRSFWSFSFFFDLPFDHRREGHPCRTIVMPTVEKSHWSRMVRSSYLTTDSVVLKLKGTHGQTKEGRPGQQERRNGTTARSIAVLSSSSFPHDGSILVFYFLKAVTTRA
jgi:hypothetical protein